MRRNSQRSGKRRLPYVLKLDVPEMRQPDGKGTDMTVDEYIAIQPEGIRETLTAVRSTSAAAIPAAEERFYWQMPIWRKHHNLIHFPPRRSICASILERKAWKRSKRRWRKRN